MSTIRRPETVQARIRIQLSAAHTQEQLERAAKAFAEVGKELGIV